MLKRVRTAFQNLNKIPSLISEVQNLKVAQDRNIVLNKNTISHLQNKFDNIDDKISHTNNLLQPTELKINNIITDSTITFEYEYIPTVRELTTGKHGEAIIAIMDRNEDGFKRHLQEIYNIRNSINLIAPDGSPDDLLPYWNNNWFESLDGISLYYFLKKYNPETYLEVGSGNSTKFARKSITDNGLRTKIISIDPFPRANIDELCDEVIRKKCEDVETEIFSRLSPGDVLMIDNSHRSFQGSDVTVFFTEILPSLQKGVLFCVHDIFLPYDYPDEWKGRFYNEQYLLLAYLLGGAGGGKIEFPVYHLAKNGLADQMLGKDFLDASHLYGGAFWMTK